MPGACERCGAQVGAEVCTFRAVFTTPNGQALNLSLVVQASRDALALYPSFFCESCFLSFLEMFTQVGEASRFRIGKA